VGLIVQYFNSCIDCVVEGVAQLFVCPFVESLNQKQCVYLAIYCCVQILYTSQNFILSIAIHKLLVLQVVIVIISYQSLLTLNFIKLFHQ
jgi:hypothetical protein